MSRAEGKEGFKGQPGENSWPWESKRITLGTARRPAMLIRALGLGRLAGDEFRARSCRVF